MAKRKVTPPRKRDRIFGDFRRQKLLRKKIPLSEAVASLICILTLVSVAWWVASRKERYDPGERDLSMQVLLASPTPKALYVSPFERWRDPALGSAQDAAAPSLAPFPDALLEGGWRASSRVLSFTPDTLYEKINGQAEQYLKFGFQRLDFVSIEHPSAGLSLDLYLYDQDNFPNALGLHAEQRGQRSVERQGPVLFTPNTLGASGLVGRLVFHAIGSSEHQLLRDKVKQFITALARDDTRSAMPVPFAVLRDRLQLPLAHISYVPINAFQLAFARDFWFGQVGRNEPGRLFLHWAESTPQARELSDKLQEAQGEELELVEREEEYSLLQHRYLKTFFAFAAAGPVVFGVEDQPDRASALAAISELRSALLLEASAGNETSPSASSEPRDAYDPREEEGS